MVAEENYDKASDAAKFLNYNCHLNKFTTSHWCLSANMNELKFAREKRMLLFERPTTYLRNWMKCIISGFIFKKRDPSFTYEVIVVDDGSKDQTTKVRKRGVLPGNQRYGILYCICKT